MKQLLTLLTLTSLLLAACGGTPTPDVEATVQAAVAATQTAQPTESPTPKPTATPIPTTVPTDTPAPTATPVPPTDTPIPPTATPIPSTVTPIPPTPTPVPVQPTATSVPVPTYSGTYRVVNVASDDVLNVRASAGVSHPIVGVVPHNGMGVEITGAGEQVDGSLWVPIEYKDIAGWVNSNYLAHQTYTVVNVASDDVLNVRANAGVAHPIVGTIPPHGMGVEVSGAGEQVDGSLWVPVEYRGITGWVNSNYLAYQVGWVDETVAAQAAGIIMALKDRNLETLSRLVHPDKGVRFSPYTYVRVEPGSPEGADLVFSSAHIANFFTDRTIYNWGRFDGSGEPINLIFERYFARFIYDADFARPHAVGYDEVIGRGNTINNTAEVYPNAITIEYHFEGFDPTLAGFDWRSLRLVLEEKEGAWYLVGIVHDEWTI
jgi:uncharacterized protein YraI